MGKKTAKKKNCLKKIRRNRISLNLLFSYLMILIVPAAAVVAVYFMAASAFSDVQEGRLTNMLGEARQTFDREVQRAENVGYYVSSEQRLQEYLSQKDTGSLKNEYFSLYTVAQSYPNYNMMNQLIQDIYVLIADSSYVMKIPQVIPQTDLGISTLSDFPFESYEKFMEYFSSQNPSRTLHIYEEESGRRILFLASRVAHRMRTERSVVVVMLDWEQIDEILAGMLAGQDGAAALLDENGRILTCVRNASGSAGEYPECGLSWEEYLAESGFGKRSVVRRVEYSDNDNWQVAVAVPENILTGSAGTSRYVVAIVCLLSLLIGLLISLTYWYQRRNVVEQYLLLRDRMGVSDKSFRFWEILRNFLGDVNQMWDTLELQKIRLRDLFLRKLFSGGEYGSLRELEEEAAQADVDISSGWYYVAYIELENPVKGGLDYSGEDFSAMMERYFEDCIKWDYYVYQVSNLAYALLVVCRDPEDEELKDAFGQMSYRVNSQLKVHSYVGLGQGSGDIEKLSGQFDTAYRLAEIARYHGMHFPVFPSDVPEEELSDRPLVFPMDMELKLLQLLRTGTEEQLEELIAQIDEVYFRPGNSRYTYRHTVEALRSAVFRSISMCGREAGAADGLRETARHAQSSGEIFALLRETRQYCALSAQEKENTAPDMDRDKAAAYIEEHYGDPNLNLAMLAEWLGEAERKTYNDFKLCFGLTFSAYLEQCRMKHACELLREGTAVRDTAEMVGYGSDYSFRRAFKRVVGIAPSDFGKLQNDPKTPD